MKAIRMTLLIVVVGVFLGLMFEPNPSWLAHTRAFAYDVYRERGRAQALASLEGYLLHSSRHFDLYFRPQDENVAELVLRTAEKVYPAVAAHWDGEPVDRVPLVLYASRKEMRSAFGWGNGESALGVYWKGTIRLLSPNVWIDGRSERGRERVFQQVNPIAHELTHYLLDYQTAGNYPRWFSEGLAQWVERKVSGYLWIEAESTLRQTLYTLADLENRFESLPKQALAYRQAYLLVRFLEAEYGADKVWAVVSLLQRGSRFDVAVRSAFGHPMSYLFVEWHKWVADNQELLESEGDSR